MRIRLRAGWSWVESVVVEDEIAIEAKHGQAIHAHLEAALRALPSPPDPGLAISRADLSATTTLTTTTHAAARTVLEAGLEPTDVEVATFRADVAMLDTDAGQTVALLHQLRDQLIKFPALADLVPEMLDEARIRDLTAAKLIQALELAETPGHRVRWGP